MTFVPDRKGDKEFPSEREAIQAAKQLNKRILKINRTLFRDYDTTLLAEAERFRRVEPGCDEFKGWIVELHNGSRPTESHYWEDSDFVSLIQQVFDEAKAMGLLPRIRRRGVHTPTGGGHLQFGLSGLFLDDIHYLPRLFTFEKNLYLDMAQKPYIRWLFSEWFDEGENSAVSLGLDELSNVNDDYAYGMTHYRGAIRRRYCSDNGKIPYSTYEHRYFDAPPNAKQLALQVQFLTAWMDHHKKLALAGMCIKFSLTQDAFKRLKNVKHAWRVISTFLRELGLNPVDYRPFFEDQYINRMRYGKMV